MDNQNIILDFWAEWCGPCKVLKPIMEKIGEDYKDKISVKPINIEEDREDLSSQYKVRNIPTVVFIKDGKEVERFVGSKNYSDIKTLVDKIY